MSETGELVRFPALMPVRSEPTPALIDVAQLLEEITAGFQRHLSLPDGAPEAIALWVLFFPMRSMRGGQARACSSVHPPLNAANRPRYP